MPVETGGSSSLPLPSGASTLAEQQTQTTHLSQIETASETITTTVATAANQTTTNSKLDTLLSQTDGIEANVDGLEGSATTTATNTTAIAGSVDQLEGYVDGLETLVTSTNSKLDTVATNQASQATAANQSMTNTRLQEIEDRVQTLEGYTDGLEGKLDSLIAKFTDGTVDNNAGAAVFKTVKSGSGRLLGFTVRHADASTLYFWLFDNTAASGTQLLIPFLVPASSQVYIGADWLTAKGVAFSTGLTYGLSTSASSYSAYGTAANVFVSAVYS